MAVIAIRTLIMYVLLIFAMRMMGKRQLGELQTIELVITLVISELAILPLQETNAPLINGLVPVLLLVALEILFSSLMVKWPFFQQFISGKAKTIINNGKIDIRAMKDIRLTIDDLAEELRNQGIFDISTVKCAIVEANGKISIMQKDGENPLTKKDVKITREESKIPIIIVSDGHISKWGLSMTELSESWIYETLKKESLSLKDVFILSADSSGEYTLIKKEKAS